MPENLKAAAKLAGLSPQQQAQVDGLFKALDVHRTLSGLPQDLAAQKFSQLPASQQNSLVQTFGKDPEVKSEPGWLKNAAHYAWKFSPLGIAVEGVKLAFKGVQELSDLSTRTYRTFSIMGDQGLDLAKAWETANDKGDKVFRPAAIKDAKAKFGDARVEVAMRLASGMGIDEAFAIATPEEKQIISDYRNGGKDGLFTDALDAVQQSKYSPGRDLASALRLRGTKAYNWVAGLGDASWRMFADPTLLAGKAKKAYDITTYSLDVMIGKGKVAEVFSKPQVRAFWDQYGSLLGQLDDAEKSVARESGKAAQARKAIRDLNEAKKKGAELTPSQQAIYDKAQSIVRKIEPNITRASERAAAARTELQRLAPDLGPTVIKEFNKPEIAIRNATDAQNWFANAKDMSAILSGQPARTVPLMPRLNTARKARIAMYTATDKVFNLNKIGPDFLKTMYVADEGQQTGDIVTGLIQNSVATGEKIKEGMATKRFTVEDIWRRIDRFSAKFEKIPHTVDGQLVVTDPEAVTTVYRIARLSLPRYQSKIIAEAFNASDVGKKKEIINGLWETVATVRGVNKTPAGLKLLNEIKGVGVQAYAPTVRAVDNDKNIIRTDYQPGFVDGKPMALIAAHLSDSVAMPSIRDLDAIASRDGLLGHVIGFSHKKWVERLTSYWSFLTLAGPRYALRNATEDLMMHLAVGNSPWGIAKGRMISTTLRLARDGRDVGVFNRLVKRSDREFYGNALRAITDDKKLTDYQKVYQMRELMAKAVTSSKLGRRLDEDELRFLQEQIRYGGIDNALAEVSEGGKNMFRGTDQMVRAVNLQKESGAVAALKFNEQLFVRRRGRGAYANFSPAMSTENKVSWIGLMNMWGKDEIGSIAITHLDGINGNAKAIREVAAYLQKPENAKLLSQFRLKARGVTVEEHAQQVVDAAANIFSKADGSLNRELWSKVVTPDGINIGDLSLEDLPVLIDDMPRMLSGPTYIPVAEGDNITASLIERGWDWMGEMNARYSREPIVIDAMLRIRKKMKADGFEQAFIKRFVDNGSTENFARKQLAALVEQRAINYTLQYVDNPAVQTQVAFASRNFARFYRATEDFYRRVTRGIRYNPDAIARSALVYDGVAHSGWVQTDANGDNYFIYPAMTPVYRVMQTVMQVFGTPAAFKTPLPVQFGGKLNMVTPSLNPDSLFPTLAGPVAGVSVNAIANIVGMWDPEAKANIQTTFLGPYAANQDFIAAVLPAHINRAYAYLNKDERNGQYASAFRKAATYLEAAGKTPKTKIVDGVEVPPSAKELEEFQDSLKSMTANILMTRFVFGFFAPASPQLDYRSDMAGWVRDSGRSSWKQVWNGLLEQYDGDVERATADWAKYFPTEMAYTVAENEKQVATYLRASKQAGAFFENNRGLFKDYPQGAAFLMPLSGEFTYEAYKILKNNGLYAPKQIGDFLREVQSAGDYAYYNQQKKSYEDSLAATPFDWEKKILRDQWQDWSNSFKGARPLLQERLANYATLKPQKIQALNDLTKMLNDKSIKVQPKTRAAMTRMLALYNQYKNTDDTTLGDDMAQMIKQGIVQEMQQIAATNPNAGAAYSSVFSGLMGV